MSPNKLVTLLVLSSTLISTHVLAMTSQIPPDKYTPPTLKPNGVCIFDVDNTLKGNNFSGDSVATGSHVHLAPGARHAIQTCLDNGYGIGIDTWASTLPTDEGGKNGRADMIRALFNPNNNSTPPKMYKIMMQSGSTCTKNDKYCHIKPYPYHAIFHASAHKKAEGMNAIMQAYYGTKEGNNNEEKSWRENYSTTKALTAISQCAILFDDDQNNINNVKDYDRTPGINFQAVKVDPNIGITQNLFDTAFNKLKKNCGYNHQSRSLQGLT